MEMSRLMIAVGNDIIMIGLDTFATVFQLSIVLVQKRDIDSTKIDWPTVIQLSIVSYFPGRGRRRRRTSTSRPTNGV